LNSAFIHFSSIAKSSFSNAAFPALGWLFSWAATGRGIAANVQKINTHTYFMRSFSLPKSGAFLSLKKTALHIVRDH
jgi:hypothetical protein